jgi:hypothetical protein
MLFRGVIPEETASRNLPNKLGAITEVLPAGTEVTLTELDRNESGLWYKTDSGGWVSAKNVNITEDIEFRYTAEANGTFDLQRFGGLASILSGNGISSATRKINGAASALGGIMGGVGGGFTGGNSMGGILGSSTAGSNAGNMKVGSLLGSMGIKIGGGSIFGKILNGTTIGSIIDGSFINDMLGNYIDSLFDNLFSRMSYVLGFDVTALLGEYYEIFDSIEGMGEASEYGGVYDPNANWEYWNGLTAAYFRYLGCDGEMITREFEGRYWEQDAYYSTPTLESSQIDEEVEFNQALYDADYSELEEAISAVEASMNLSITRTDWFFNFNRYHVNHPDYNLPNSVPYVFITRPDLNIFDADTGEVNDSIKQTAEAAFFYEASLKHQNVCLSLTSQYSGSHDFIPLLSNTADSLDIQDESIKTIETGETLTGWKIVYARHDIESKTAGTINISYTDDNMLSIYLMHKIWHEYMNGVSRGIFGPKDSYARNGIIDYASSIYYILTDQTGENIIFWTKYYGAFPTNCPSSTFSYNKDNPIKTPSLSIQYAYSFKEDMNPLALAEFNGNSSGDFTYVPVYNENTFRCNSTLVGPPFIDTDDGGTTYKIRFRPKEYGNDT